MHPFVFYARLWDTEGSMTHRSLSEWSEAEKVIAEVLDAILDHEMHFRIGATKHSERKRSNDLVF
jgi:hypothetical protein